MESWTLAQTLFAVFVGTFSIAAAWCDLRTRKIPNALTIPMFALGWAYQAYFFGLPGVIQGAAAFGIGFGVLFLLWMMGSGGGGDVKLIGALSVWLGVQMTILVIVSSTIVVLVGTFLIVAVTAIRGGFNRAKERFVKTGPETPDERAKRRVMAYALPVAVATWAVMLLELPPI